MVSTSCPFCTGKRPFCIHKSYPLPRVNIEHEVAKTLKKDVFGPSTSVFVGKYGYPDVFAGPMVGLADKENIDSPSQWFGKDYAQIIELRSFLLRSKRQENIRSRSRFVQDVQELALAKKPADVEMSFVKRPVFSFRLSDAFQPMGPSGTVERMHITDDVKVRPRIEYIATDETPAQETSFRLYSEGLDIYRITSIFSSGILGKEGGRKLVPTRWSITALDDLLTNRMLEHIRTYPQLTHWLVGEAQYMDNHFVVLLLPGAWEFENFEVWAPGSNWSTQTQAHIIPEYEPFSGRTTYADSQAGGYYASRISAAQYLEKRKCQARVVVIREVYEGYSIPLGVWVVRETSRRAYENMRTFTSQADALADVRSRLRLPLSQYTAKSIILRQKRLGDYVTSS